MDKSEVRELITKGSKFVCGLLFTVYLADVLVAKGRASV
jgi:hypothetical protein